jgi:hypothetical protein
MFDILKYLLNIGFRKITILPVYYTKIWSKSDLEGLDLLLKKIVKLYHKLKGENYSFDLFYVRTNNESEYNINKNDFEFILDYDGKIYADYETELYLLNDVVSDNIFSKNEILLSDITDNKFSFIDLIIKRSQFNTLKYINKITNHFKINDNLSDL